MIFFTIFDIAPLWMDKFGWNWWPDLRVFDALTESGKIFDQNDPQHFWETLEAGAKKWIFSPFWLFWSKNLGTFAIENDKKSLGKLNYCLRSNQYCNQHGMRVFLQHEFWVKFMKGSGPILSPKWPKLPKIVILSYPLFFEALPNLYASTYWHADCTIG